MELLAALSAKAMGNYGTGTESVSMDIFVEKTKVFSGFMNSSIANMNMTPNAALMINATANADLQKKAAPPFSFNGTIPVSEVLSSICKAAEYEPLINGLTNSGLSSPVATNPHYVGSVFEQLNGVCNDFRISMSIMPPQISFWPTESKIDDVIPLISPEYGLIGYPIFSNGGVMFQTQFSTLLTTGRHINLATSLPHASGTYKLTSVTHELSSWIPDGPWHSICIANRPVERG
ncbi:hypothetical protein [Pectobacterium polaris]|uniref:hypothetical protein n=1 Tax=Pectobacterium polaris TaxID=2042057 RepID=UPI0032F00C55